MSEPSALREQLTSAMIPVFALDRTLLKPEEFRIIDELVTAVLGVILPHGKFLGDQLRDSEATLQRVLQAIDNLAAEPHPSHDHVCPDDVRETVRAALATPDPAAGPTVAEAAAHDRRWPLEKHGE